MVSTGKSPTDSLTVDGSRVRIRSDPVPTCLYLIVRGWRIEKKRGNGEKGERGMKMEKEGIVWKYCEKPHRGQFFF